MERQKIKSFDELKHGDKIISPIDNEVTLFSIDSDGIKYLTSKHCAFPAFQFNAEDFYTYAGTKEVGEIDNDYLKE